MPVPQPPRRRHGAALALVLALLALAAAPAGAATETVVPGLQLQQLTRRLADGAPAVVHVLEVAPGAHLEVRPVLAKGRVPGLETVSAMGARLRDDGYLAGTNGGFWLTRPVGEPNGLLAVDGHLISEAQTQGGSPRGTFGTTKDGGALLDRVATTLTLDGPGLAEPLAVTGVDRLPDQSPPFPDGDRPVLVYQEDFGPVPVAPIAESASVRTLVVEGLAPVATGVTEGVVTDVRSGSGEGDVPAGGALVVAHGDSGDALAGVDEGDELRLRTALSTEFGDPADWDGLVNALAGGPLILRDGQPTPASSWEAEGFAPQSHSAVRHPRTAVARRGDGTVLLVTVDGRQPGVSAGMTLTELAALLLDLGAVDGLSLDGGGSTAMVVDGRLRNRPCCDQGGERPVATGLFVRGTNPLASSERLAGADRTATAAAVAVADDPATGGEVVLAAAADFPDALAGGPLAASRGAPILLTEREGLPEATAAALDALAPETITVLGGTRAVGVAVTDRLTAQGYIVRRLAGAERTATAAAIAGELGAAGQTAFLTGAGAWPDALTAAAPAGLLGAPVLLTDGRHLSAAARQALGDLGIREVIVAGGDQAVSADVVRELEATGLTVTRVAGTDRYGTAAALADWARTRLIGRLDQGELVVARGDTFPDALSGGPLAVSRRALLTIVPEGDVTAHPAIADLLADLRPSLQHVTLLGGPGALSVAQEWQLDALAAE